MSTGPSLRVADIVAGTLHAHGVRHAFGMPGGEVVTLVDALEAAGIGFVLTRHETPAAIAAAATSLYTKAPGLLVTTLGPGLANAANGIADAVQERMPLLVVSGVVDRAVRGRYTHQVLDHAKLLAGLAKASFEIEAEGAGETVARAIRLALAPPMGPVHLDLAPGVAAAAAISQDVSAPGMSREDQRSGADGVERLRTLFGAARRPLVLAGFQAARDGQQTARALVALADGHSVPVITTYKGKGVLDEAHPAALGGAGLSPRADVELLRVVKAADLAILVGYDPIEMRPGWLNPFGPDATVVEITTAPVDHGMHRADLQIVGPPALALSALLNCPVEARWPQEEPQTARAALARLFAPPATWGPHAIVQVLQEEAPPDAVVTVDSGAHRILLSQMWKARLPLSLLQSAGWCTMGAAVPLAMGVAIARPGRPVAAVVGDGGLEMVAGELGTLRDRGLPVVVVVFQDASLALIELKQAAAGLARAGVGLGRTDLAGLAGAFGGRGVTVADAEGLRTALRDAFSAPTFTLVACAFDADQYAGAF